MGNIKAPAVLLLWVVALTQVYAQGYSDYRTDSLLKQLNNTLPDTNRVKILYDIAYGYQYTSPKKGVEYGLRAFVLADSLHYKKGKATAMAITGMNYAALGDYKNALIYESEAIVYYKHVGNLNSEAAMLSNISLIYSNQASYARALEFAYAALSIYEKLDLKGNQAYLLDNIGTIYFRKKKLQKALDCYKQAEIIYSHEQNKDGLARIWGNKGNVYHELKNYNKALALHQKAFEINKLTGSKSGMQINLTNMGNAYLSKNNFEAALEHYQKAIDVNKELSNEGGIAIVTGNIGTVYLKKAQLRLQKTGQNASGDIQQAIKYLSEATNKCKLLELLHPYTEFLLPLAESYELKGDYKTANGLLREHHLLNDSISSYEIEQRITGMEINRKLDLKDKNILLKEQQIHIRDLQLKNSRSMIAVYGFLILIALISIAFLWRKNRRNKVISGKLKLENDRYLQQISDQLTNLQKHSTVLREIAYMQAHDVRGPVASILGMAQLFNKNDFSHPDNKFIIEHIEEVTKKLDEAVQAVIRKENDLRE